MIARARAARLAAATLVVAIAAPLAGCVYLRLLELKHQIAAFDQNFDVQTDAGVRIVCRRPVLLTDDVRWIGLAPEKTRKLGHAEEWQVRWIKQLPADVHETAEYDIAIDLTFADDKLTRVAIPERYFVVMPKSFLLDMLRSLGAAKVDRDKKTVEAQLATAQTSLPAVGKLFGRPSEEHVEGTETYMRYRYVPAGGTGLARRAVFDMSLYFDTATGNLLRWRGKTPVGEIGFNFEKPPETQPN